MTAGYMIVTMAYESAKPHVVSTVGDIVNYGVMPLIAGAASMMRQQRTGGGGGCCYNKNVKRFRLYPRKKFRKFNKCKC